MALARSDVAGGSFDTTATSVDEASCPADSKHNTATSAVRARAGGGFGHTDQVSGAPHFVKRSPAPLATGADALLSLMSRSAPPSSGDVGSSWSGQLKQLLESADHRRLLTLSLEASLASRACRSCSPRLTATLARRSRDARAALVPTLESRLSIMSSSDLALGLAVQASCRGGVCLSRHGQCMLPPRSRWLCVMCTAGLGVFAFGHRPKIDTKVRRSTPR